MAYTTAEGRQVLLDGLVRGANELGYALTALGAAYEALDEATADALEEALFGPVQKGYGRAKRTATAFAARSQMVEPTFEDHEAGLPSSRARGFIDQAVDGIRAASEELSGVQDAPELIEVGDSELRAALVELRGLVDPLPERAHEITRRLGR